MLIQLLTDCLPPFANFLFLYFIFLSFFSLIYLGLGGRYGDEKEIDYEGPSDLLAFLVLTFRNSVGDMTPPNYEIWKGNLLMTNVIWTW